MSQVRLGKVHLHWCPECNVPIVEEGTCEICGEKAEKVKITPPGDVRPAFDHDLDLIRKTIDRQWGTGFSENLIERDKLAVLNNTPGLDRMDEVIVDGVVIGNLRYNVLRKAMDRDPYDFILRPWEGITFPKKRYVIVDKGAIEPISDGGSILCPGVIEADENIERYDEVMIYDEEENILASGPAQMCGEEMLKGEHGKAVKNRWRTSDRVQRKGNPGWDDAIEANDTLISKRVDRAKDFIRSNIEKSDLPPAVAYSGGKDSLATLHLLLDAGIDPDLMFIDTGIELPETIENVKNIAEKFGLEKKIREAHSGYWRNVNFFGPSARDHRWCCKTCKLGPTAKLIAKNYPDGVLSFIGQRRYESQQRQNKGNTWNNPWVPGQEALSPIQDWTALHIWLYLFKKDADYNPLYEKGFERIGCWVCPASDLAELESIQKNHEDFERLDEMLEKYRKEKQLPNIWKELGMWRWIDIPEEMERIVEEVDENIDVQRDIKDKIDGDVGGDKSIYHADDFDIGGVSFEDMLSDQRTRNLLNIIEKDKRDKILQGGNEQISTQMRDEYKELIWEFFLKAKRCVECGICVARCPNEALYFDEGIKVDPERCISCKECMGKCPVIDFNPR